MDTVKEDILKVRDYIDEHGWCRGVPSNDKGEVCLIGAMHRVDIRFLPTYGALADYLDNSVSTWNDYTAKNKQDVLDTLTRIAEGV